MSFQVQYGLAKQTALVVDQSAFRRAETIWMDEYPYVVTEMRYAFRMPVVTQDGGVDINGLIGLVREHDLAVSLLLRELRATRARLDLVLDLVCEVYTREFGPLLADPAAALVHAAHDERDRQAARRAAEAAEADRVSSGGRA